MIIFPLIWATFYCCNQPVSTNIRNNESLIKADSLDFYARLHLPDTGCSAFERIVTEISCEEAKAIARKEGYWSQNHWIYPPHISLTDSVGKKIWVVESFTISYSNEGECANSNGCKIITQKKLGVHAQTGAIVYKEQQIKKIPKYE